MNAITKVQRSIMQTSKVNSMIVTVLVIAIGFLSVRAYQRQAFIEQLINASDVGIGTASNLPEVHTSEDQRTLAVLPTIVATIVATARLAAVTFRVTKAVARYTHKHAKKATNKRTQKATKKVQKATQKTEKKTRALEEETTDLTPVTITELLKGGAESSSMKMLLPSEEFVRMRQRAAMHQLDSLR